MIINGKFFVEPRQSTDNFKVLFVRLAAQGAGRPVDQHGVADGPWTPETLADAISAIDTNKAGIDVRTVQVWFQANNNGISDKNIHWLARIFGCNDPLATSRWQSQLKAAKEQLAAERRQRQRITSKADWEARGQVQGQNTQVNEFPNEVEAPSNQHEPGHQKISLAARAESLFLNGAPFAMVMTMWACVAILLYISYLLGAHDVSYSPVKDVEKQVGLFWSPNWFLDRLIWLPLIVFTVSSLVTSWREQWRPLMVAESPDPTQSCSWNEKLAVYSSSFVGITLVCFCIVFLLQWYGSYLQPLMQNYAGSRVIDWLLISIERPDVMSANQGMAASMYANLLSGIAYWYCFSGLMLLCIVSMDFKEVSGRVSFGHNTIKSLEILQIADAIVSGIFRCAVFALFASIGIKLVAVYLMTDSENIVRWLILDASALMNGRDGSWTWFDKNPSASITSFFVMFIPVFVFFLCASQIRGSVRSLLIAEQAGNRGSIGPVGAATKKMMINWLSRASVILLLAVNFWLIGRFTGFSVLLLSSCCLAVFCVVASQGSHPSTDIPRNEELLGVQGK
ncbi:MAG: hypothetical protein AAFO63_05665 [Pseudomonadota bacterium]